MPDLAYQATAALVFLTAAGTVHCQTPFHTKKLSVILARAHAHIHRKMHSPNTPTPLPAPPDTRGAGVTTNHTKECYSPSEPPRVTTSGAPPLLLLSLLEAALLPPLLLLLLLPAVAGAGARGGAVLRTNTLTHRQQQATADTDMRGLRQIHSPKRSRAQAQMQCVKTLLGYCVAFHAGCLGLVCRAAMHLYA
jgi:hypothetical protein